MRKNHDIKCWRGRREHFHSTHTYPPSMFPSSLVVAGYAARHKLQSPVGIPIHGHGIAAGCLRIRRAAYSLSHTIRLFFSHFVATKNSLMCQEVRLVGKVCSRSPCIYDFCRGSREALFALFLPPSREACRDNGVPRNRETGLYEWKACV